MHTLRTDALGLTVDSIACVVFSPIFKIIISFVSDKDMTDVGTQFTSMYERCFFFSICIPFVWCNWRLKFDCFDLQTK